ncbi:hypothetical protein A9G34_01650 [Gilliamella sp. Choc4-2]|uniref:hypothetical protein n=1 Tax=unclassified Gilliamella TaxID=2685620 RepID=UPI00080DC78F|nr:hypothetical protein [Gilliamella apicola]OCG32828.1 hypothetical protein A9G33_02170 [Gilliamella apicola]OCG45827.1 hypothetical protein A9G34_01650 [Gilliamella apicola]OCG56201.1 hypothetical protein A9G36_03965 [Gilliamella apicola]
MELAIVGIIANWLAVFYINVSLKYDEASQILLPLVIIFALVATIGLIITTHNKKIGGILIIIGSILFVPLGLIGVLGGRKIISQENAKSLEERRHF